MKIIMINMFKGHRMNLCFVIFTTLVFLFGVVSFYLWSRNSCKGYSCFVHIPTKSSLYVIKKKLAKKKTTLFSYDKKCQFSPTMQKKRISKKGHIPDVIGIGIRKCGTGVYMKFLQKHGSFSFPLWYTFETEYFSKKRACGLEWYKQRFDGTQKNKLFIEKTPHYFYAAPKTIPQDILKLNPNMKIILLLCEPVARALSCFIHHSGFAKTYGSLILSQSHHADVSKKKQLTNTSLYKNSSADFDDYVMQYLPVLKERLSQLNEVGTEEFLIKSWNSKYECLLAGLYSVHLERWMNTFNDTQMLILDGEGLMKNPGPEYVKLQQFLSVPTKFGLNSWVRNDKTGHFCLRLPARPSEIYCQDNGVNKARTRTLAEKIISTPNERTLTMLKDFYKPYNNKLFNILQQKLNWS